MSIYFYCCMSQVSTIQHAYIIESTLLQRLNVEVMLVQYWFNAVCAQSNLDFLVYFTCLIFGIIFLLNIWYCLTPFNTV